MHRIESGKNFVTYQLGALKITSLRDGYVDMPVSRLRQLGNRPFDSDLPAQLRLVDGSLRLSVNAFAIGDEGDVILVDTGASNAWHPSMGLLPDALKEAGIPAEKVRTVALTHTHIDHINGLVLPDGEDGFPALSKLFIPVQELGLFCAEQRLERFHAKVETFTAGQKIGSCVQAVPAPGHEVGHTCFQIGSGPETLMVWGDIVHVPSLQFEQPSISWEFDADQDAARASRLRIMSLAADHAYYVAGAHLDFPGVGRVLRSGASYRFQPL